MIMVWFDIHFIPLLILHTESDTERYPIFYSYTPALVLEWKLDQSIRICYKQLFVHTHYYSS